MKLAAILFVTGLILAGSTGPWFPWLNYAGAIIFCLFPVAAWRSKEMRRRGIINEGIHRR